MTGVLSYIQLIKHRRMYVGFHKIRAICNSAATLNYNSISRGNVKYFQLKWNCSEENWR